MKFVRTLILIAMLIVAFTAVRYFFGDAIATFVTDVRVAAHAASSSFRKATPTPTPSPFGGRVIRCSVCGGEGGVMVRRSPIIRQEGRVDAASPTVQDIRVTCPLCMGRGSRSLTLPPRTGICPDCGGMGKRLTQNEELPSRMGFIQNAPTTTGCSRCLGKGYVSQLTQ